MAKRDFRKGAELAWENGRALLEEAEHLLRKARFGYSLGLTMLAIEELAKAEIYTMWSEGVQTYPDYEAFTREKKLKLRKTREAIRRHEAKFDFFVNFLSLSELAFKFLGVEEAISQGLFSASGTLSAEVRWFVRSRQRSFYVDFEDGEWYTPLAVQRASPEFLLGYARKYMLWVARLRAEGWFATREPLEEKLQRVLSRGKTQGEPTDELGT